MYRLDANKIENAHLLGVVDSSLGGLLLVKTVIQIENPDLRNYNIGLGIDKDSVWIVEKVGTFINFNRSYLALSIF